MTWYSDNPPTKLYHKDLGFPHNMVSDYGTMPLQYSNHAMRAALDDRYGNILNLPPDIDTSKAQVIEAEMDGDKTIKVVYRIPYAENLDLVLVVMPERKFVKTVWLNRNDDRHKTLDTSKYDIPEKPRQLQIPTPEVANSLQDVA